MYAANRGAKREMGGIGFKWGDGHHWPPPLATALVREIIQPQDDRRILLKALLHNILAKL